MSDKFLAVVKLKTSEEVLAKIEMSPQGDVMSLDYPAMVGESSFTRKTWRKYYQNRTLD